MILMTMLHEDIAVSSPSIKTDRYHYKAVSNQKDWQNVFSFYFYSFIQKKKFHYLVCSQWHILFSWS